MFLVLNKEKIYTYIISMLTVLVLLFTASNINLTKEEVIDASAREEKILTTYKDNVMCKNEMQNYIK